MDPLDPMEQTLQQVLEPEFQEQLKHHEELMNLVTEFSRHPEKIAGIVQTLPFRLDPSESPSRYIIAEAIRYVIPLYGDNRSTFHTVCTTGLPEALLGVATDPLIYLWHDESSRFYHPKLGVSRSLSP